MPVGAGRRAVALDIDFHTQMELPFHYLMLKQAARIKYELRAALHSAGLGGGQHKPAASYHFFILQRASHLCLRGEEEAGR